MATKKISALPAVTTLTAATDVFPVNASNVTSKITLANLIIQLAYQAHTTTLDTYSGITPSALGQALLAVVKPGSTSYLKSSGLGVPSFDTPAQLLANIAGQPRSTNLDLLAALTSSVLGQNILVIDNATRPAYLRVVGNLDQDVQQLTPSQVAAELKPLMFPPIVVDDAASPATITPNADLTDFYNLSGLANILTINAPTGGPGSGQRLIIRLKDAGVGKALTWNAIYRFGTPAKPTTTVANHIHTVELIYNTSDNKWDALSVSDVV